MSCKELRSNKSNKPELVAIYRLEFYRNKKKWKFSNEKKKQSSEPVKTERVNKLNKTYDIEPSYDSEKENSSPLNNAFMHEISNDTPENEPSAPPPSPELSEDILPQASEPPIKPFSPDVWVNNGTSMGSGSLLQKSETQETFASYSTDALQQSAATSRINQSRPVNNSEWLLKTASLPVTTEIIKNRHEVKSWQPSTNMTNDQGPGSQNSQIQEPWTNQLVNNLEFNPENMWSTSVSATNSEQFNQQNWSIPPPALAGHLHSKSVPSSVLKSQHPEHLYYKDDKIPVAPPANCLQMLLCPDKWKKPTSPQDKQFVNPQKTDPALWTNPAPEPMLYNQKQNDNHQQLPHHNPQADSLANQPLLTPPPLPKRFNPEICSNQQKPPPNFLPEMWTNSPYVSQFNSQGCNQGLTLPNQPAAQQRKSQLSSHRDPKMVAPLPNPEKCPSDSYCDHQKGQNRWKNPVLLLNQEVLQPSFSASHGGKNQENLGQSRNQEWYPTSEDIPDVASSEDGQTLDPQYLLVDQNTLKPSSPTDSENLTPEQIRCRTDEWLHKLLALYRPRGDCNPPCEDNQIGVNESLDFIREAHEVPHSSDKDPNETRECVCSYLPTSSFSSLSSRRLSAAVQHATEVLQDVLREQIIRDRLRSQTLLHAVEYPTRDTELFGSEYVMGGSHVPHCTSELRARVIKIDMGRPYRL